MVIDFKTGCGVKIRKVQPAQPVRKVVVTVAQVARPIMIFASAKEAAQVRAGFIAAGLITPL